MLLSFDESHEFWSWLLIWENSLLPYKDELKKKSDFITLSNDNDGVAYFLNNFIDYE